MQNEDVNPQSLSVYSTLVVTGEEISVYFKLTKMCHCTRTAEAATCLIYLYYVFDVQFPAQIVNTCNFLDIYIGRMDKKGKIRSSVQRKINMLMAA